MPDPTGRTQPPALTYPAQLIGASRKLAAGYSPEQLGLAGWTITDRELVLGQGRECFEAATRRLLSWQAHARAGVRVHRQGDHLRLRFGPTESPCRILSGHTTENTTVLVYGTLSGHLECGEETFLITFGADGAVTGRCVAFSRHTRFWVRLAAPVARWVQLRITRGYLVGMRP